MKQIYGQGAVSMIAFERGVIFSALQQDSADEQRRIISYRQHSFDNGSTALVTRSVYLLSKFGNNFEQYLRRNIDYINSSTVPLSGYRLLVAMPDGSAAIYDNNCELRWSGSLKYKGFAPADFAAQGEFLWCSYPESNQLIKYNVNSMQQSFRVSGASSGEIYEPAGLWLFNERLYVTSLSSGKISSVNLNDFSVETIWTLDEPAYKYIKIDSNEVVLTKSGIYRL